MKELYAQISDWMDANPDGWCSKEKAMALVGCILAIRPTTVLEVGIWSGKSFIPMAMALRHLKIKGCIIGIDPWKAEASVEGIEGEHKKWWSEVDHERIFKQFTESLVTTQVAPWTKVFRCRSDEWPIPGDLLIDLAHIDGGHGDFAAVYDVTHLAARVRIGGLLWWDDLTWSTKASSMQPTLGFVELFRLDTGAMLQRIKT